MPRYPKHLALVYSTQERRMWCEDRERTIDNFDALMTTIRIGLAGVPTIWRHS
jgi:hypothetical protein